MPEYEITSPNRLSDEDWDDIRGTSLFETMFRNRAVVHIRALNPVIAKANNEIKNWLEERTESFYHVFSGSGMTTIYFESNAELVAFTLAFKGEPLPKDMPDVGRPVPAHRSGPSASPTVNWPYPSDDNPVEQFRDRYGVDLKEQALRAMRRTY